MAGCWDAEAELDDAVSEAAKDEQDGYQYKQRLQDSNNRSNRDHHQGQDMMKASLKRILKSIL